MGFWSTLADIGNGIWNAITGVAPVVTAGVATYDQIKTNEINNEILRDNNRINELNYQLQRDNLNYQKSLQQTMFGREDTSVQRRVADLTAAGLSPTLAAGSGASAGPVVSTRAPQMDKKQLKLATMSSLANVQTLIANQQKAQTEADIAKTHLEQEKMNTQFYRSRGLAPVQANQSWQQHLVNLIAPMLENKVALPILGSATSSLGEAVNRAITNTSLHDVNTADFEIVENGNKVINKKTGAYLTTMQAGYLKQKHLYQQWIQEGFTPDVLKALRMFSAQTTTRVHGGSGRKF